MKQKSLLKTIFLLCALVVGSSAWADVVVTLDNIGAGLGSTANTTAATTDITATGTTDSYTLNYYQCKKQGNAMLMTKSVSPYISNKTAMPGNIKSVEVFINSGASGKTTYDCAFSTTECTSATSGIGAVNITGGNSHIFSNLTNGSINVQGKYFCITLGNANNGQVLKLVITCESSTYTITPASNNDSWGTVALDGNVITANPASGYQFASPAYTVSPANSATVSQNGNDFTVTPSANTTVTINFEAIPTYTVTLSDDTENLLTEENGGSGVTLPSRSDKGIYTFEGWSTTDISTGTYLAPTIIPAGTYQPTANITLYPVYKCSETTGTATTATQTIEDYADANGWQNDQVYHSVVMDANVKVEETYNEDSKYYTSDNTWRIYGNGTIEVTCTNGTINTITFTFSEGDVEWIHDGSSVTSGNAVTVNESKSIFWVNATTKITAISVNYTPSTYYTRMPNEITGIDDTYSINLANNESEVDLSEATATYGTVLYEVSSSTIDDDYYELTEGQLTVSAQGVIAIRAYVEATGNYPRAEKVVTVSVTDDPVIAYENQTESTVYGTPYTVDASLIEGGDITLESNNLNIATIDGLVITPVAVGTVTITINTAATNIYNAGSATFTLNVTQPAGSETAQPATSGGSEQVLFHESFGNNSGSAREWDDSYSVKTGVSSVYSGITSYTVSNVKQGKNTTGSTQSGLNQSSQGNDASIIIGPLNVDDYCNLRLTYQWKAASTKGSYSTSAYYATSSTGGYTEIEGTGTGATSFVECSYSLPETAQVSTLYLMIVWNTSNTQGIIDEVELIGDTEGVEPISVTLNGSGFATYCYQYPLDLDRLDENVKAYIIKNVSGNDVAFERITGTIKGGVPFILYGTAGAHTLYPAASDCSTVPAGNLLEGTLAPMYIDATEAESIYGLSGDKFKKSSGAGTIRANKAFLRITDAARELDIIFSDQTGIENVNVNLNANREVYDLQGRRVAQPTKGLYIVNGKKVVLN